MRSAPGVLILPPESEFGWDPASIAFAVAVGILTFGLGPPLAGAVLNRFGPRPVMLLGMGAMVLGLTPLLIIRELRQRHLFWGLVTGLVTGAFGSPLGATVAARWFKTHRGAIIGLLSAANSAGPLVFLPLLMAITVAATWHSAVGLLVLLSALFVVPIVVLMRNQPSEMGRAIGDDGAAQSAAERAEEARRTSPRDATHTRDF